MQISKYKIIVPQNFSKKSFEVPEFLTFIFKFLI